MRILVVGAGGVGSSVVPIAARRDFFEAMVVADYDAERARRTVDRLGGDPRFSAARIDASSAADVTELCRAHGITHVLNAVDPRFVMPIFEGAFTAGADYLDMAMSLSHPHPDRPYAEVGVKLGDEQFARADAWSAAGRLALVGIGVEPGLSDVFARYAADHLFTDDRRGRRARRREPRGRRLRLRPVVLDLDDDRGVPEPAGHLGARPRLVHDPAVQRARDVRLPGGDRAGRVRERRARGGAPHPALGRLPGGSRSSTASATSSSRSCRSSTSSASTGPSGCGSAGSRSRHGTSWPPRSPTRRASAIGCTARPAPGPG